MALGFYFDMTRCIGCRACAVACKDKNRLDGDSLGVNLRIAKTYCTGTFPDVKCFSYSAACNHCEDPACMKVCSTGALYKAEDGTVILDEALCIADLKCVNGCPYKVPQFDEAAGVVKKCDACASLRAKGENPACVDACPMRALDFGDLDELEAKYGKDLVCDLAILPNSSITGPHVRIRAKEFALSGKFEEMML
jgi:anaerobic dimethyl sulfoxide reductase subunit B (iron-sulfur subunit)